MKPQEFERAMRSRRDGRSEFYISGKKYQIKKEEENLYLYRYRINKNKTLTLEKKEMIPKRYTGYGFEKILILKDLGIEISQHTQDIFCDLADDRYIDRLARDLILGVEPRRPMRITYE